MNLRLILCAFGWHRWTYTQRGHLDSRSKTRACACCRAPEVGGFLMGGYWGEKVYFELLGDPSNDDSMTTVT